MDKLKIENEEKMQQIQEILQQVVVVKKMSERSNVYYKPIKNTSKQDCYKALYEINKIIGIDGWGESFE